MHQPRSLVATIFTLIIVTFCSNGLYAQQFDPSYDVSLQLIIGSDEAGSRTDIPNELAGVTKQIKGQFGFKNYRLVSAFLGRLTNAGSFSYKSASDLFGKETPGQPIFLEWNLADFRAMPNGKSGQGFLSQGFNFGARIPVSLTSIGGDGKATAVTSYESIGLTLRKVGLGENTPAIIGTLNLPGMSGTIFLVMTVRSADL